MSTAETAAPRDLARFAPLVAAVLALAVYLPSVRGGFLYDDVHQIVENRALQEPVSLGSLLAADPARPLLTLSWALNHALGGLAPWHYHLVNVLIHAGNAALVAWLLLWMAGTSGRRELRGPALVAACIFAVSPMAAETVAYVSSRSTALAAFLMLVTLRLAAPALGDGARRLPLPALGTFLLALLTKEEAVSLPLFLLLLDYFFVAGRNLGRVVRHARFHIPFLALPVLGLAARRVVTGTWLPAPALDPVRYLLTQAAAFPGYLTRALIPVFPAFYRGAPAAGLPPDLATVGLGLVGTGLIVAAVALRHRFADASFAVLWMAAGLLPSSSLVALKEMVVDHRAYLGMAGVCLVLGRLLWGRVRPAVLVVLLLVLGARSLHYEWVLADPVRAWKDAVAHAPGSVEAWIALGDAYQAANDVTAELAYKKAVGLDPWDARAWTNLGNFFLREHRFAEAESAMRRAAQDAPGDSRIHDNLGAIIEYLGRWQEAEKEYELAIAGQPVIASPRINLARVLIARGDYDRARALLESAKSLEIDAQDARQIESLEARLP